MHHHIKLDFSILPSVCLANEFPFIICQVSINAFSYASSYDWTEEGGKCLHVVILLLFPCSLMVSTKLLWYDCTQLDKVEKQQNQIEKRSQSSRSSTIWEAWLKELSHKSFSRSKESIIKKGTLVAQITKWIYNNNNLLKMYKVERMEFWISKNIFNNALEMMKSYKNECLVK